MNPKSSRSSNPSNPQRRKHLATILGLGLFIPLSMQPAFAKSGKNFLLIDNFLQNEFRSKLGTQWRAVSDRVMGGVSEVTMTQATIEGRQSLRLFGDVRVENNGGFIQAALDLTRDGGTLDASNYTGLQITVRGNNQGYSIHLRTPDNTRPWQSYRAHFSAGSEWKTIKLPFKSFKPYRLQAPLDTTRLRRIGLVAIGRAFKADLAISEIAFYR